MQAPAVWLCGLRRLASAEREAGQYIIVPICVEDRLALSNQVVLEILCHDRWRAFLLAALLPADGQVRAHVSFALRSV